ncbi:MAG TPA: hypothetical protein VFH33_01715, partial [Candidatus Krumholzibacteria bacterium]|nr:hypothetical protein [Candidatus Krumholzibacteria bacterium]
MNARALLASFLFVFIATNARAAWQLDGIPLCKDPAQQYAVTAAPDGSGGALVAWQDSRNAGGEDIYIRRIDADGGPMWALDGVPACLAPGDQLEPRIVGDGTGGAFVTWFDLRNGNDYDIYVQHVDASGVALWGAGGVAICTEPNDQVDARIVNDGSGGIVVVWLDDRAGVYARHVYGQRVDVTGVAQWTAQGIPICTASTYRSDMNIVTDGTGTFIVAWEDWYRIAYIQGFAQKVDATGGIGWFPDGIPLTLYNTPQASLSLVSDGAGGAIAAWQDARNAGGDDIYAQRVSAAGSLVWDPDGVAV